MASITCSNLTGPTRGNADRVTGCDEVVLAPPLGCSPSPPPGAEASARILGAAPPVPLLPACCCRSRVKPACAQSKLCCADFAAYHRLFPAALWQLQHLICALHERVAVHALRTKR